ncbi:MAG: tetratricopeptide repeat protein [Pirellulales bacterium]
MAARNMTLAHALAALWFVVLAASAVGKPPVHLVPFPEDAQQSQAAEAKPARPQPPQSNFQPRFRVPAVTQAEYTEPETAAQNSKPAEADDSRQPQPLSGTDAAPVEGREALSEAYAKSNAAKSEGDYTEIITLCSRAKQGGLNKTYDDYAERLLGWAYNRRGEARSQTGKDVEALADFEAAVAAGGTWRAIHNRGVGYAAAGRIEEALADLNRAVELNPRYPHAYFNRGELRYTKEDFPGAIDDYTLAIRLGSRAAAVYTSRGHAYYRMQRFGDALRDYGEAIKVDPENAAALVNRGDTYSDLGKYGEAAKDYRAAVRVAPKNGRAFQAAAWLMATCPDTHYRDEKLAVDAAQRAIELDGASYRNLSTLAAAQASAGLFKEARQTQEQTIAAAPKKDVVTAEKMMALYQREIAYRDRPLTAFKTPEEMDDKEVRQAAAAEPVRPAQRPAQGRRAWFEAPSSAQRGAAPELERLPPPSQFRQPGQSPPTGRPPKARLFSPRGRI